MPGYESRDPCRSVALEWEAAEQDGGFSCRAVRTWAAGEQPVTAHAEEAGFSNAYSSTLQITYDDGPAEPSTD